MDIYSKIDEIGEYVEKAKTVPLMNQKMLDTEYLMRMLEELYASIPQEIKNAKTVIEDEQKRRGELDKYAQEMMTRTQAECEKILRGAKEESDRILDENHLKQMVEDEARRIKREVLDEVESLKQRAMEEAENIRREALEHARELEKRSMTRARKIKIDADQYAEEILNQIEGNINELLVINKNGRKFLTELKEKDILEPSLI